MKGKCANDKVNLKSYRDNNDILKYQFMSALLGYFGKLGSFETMILSN
jgi:hypothetical protein